MDVKGRLLVLLRVLVTEDAVLLEMPADRLDFVEPTLVHYRVAAPVRFAARPTAVLGLLGPRRGGGAGCARGSEVPATPRASRTSPRRSPARRSGSPRASDLPAGGWAVHAAPEQAAAVTRP